MLFSEDKVVIASDVSTRDGIGIEIYRDNQLLIEIFRDDTEKTREVTVYSKSISLELMEESIRIFKEEIPWDFIADADEK